MTIEERRKYLEGLLEGNIDSNTRETVEAILRSMEEDTSISCSLDFVHPIELRRVVFNPPRRTNKLNMRAILATTVMLGKIVVPVVAVEEGGVLILVDGHRRVESATQLGLTEIPVIVLRGISKERAYALFVQNTLAMNSNDQETLLERGLDPNCVNPLIAEATIELARILNIPLQSVKSRCRRYAAVSVVSTMNRIILRIGLSPDDAFRRTVVDLLLSRRCIDEMLRSLGNDVDPDFLFDCVSEGKIPVLTENGWEVA